MPMPRPSDKAKAYFESVLPEDPRVSTRPMFGQVAAFVNGNMFMGLFGDDLFVRLSDADQSALMREKGASPFTPMEGRPMKGYVVVPSSWLGQAGKVKPWVERSLAFTASMPPKEKKAKKGKKQPKK
ncbi:MAG: TfoX/Sxy family protein [SAR202 cluster bacterium]|nr:TfoX/Sxy family protein [SAR202 cluster bacterium]